MQSMAAMFALPSVSTFASDYGAKQYDFAPWVCNYSTRFNLSKPFDWNGYSIATDGRKLVRVPMVESVCGTNLQRTPNVSGLPWETFQSGGWKPYKEHRVAQDETTCEACLGIGWIGNPEWREFDLRSAPEVYQRRILRDMMWDYELESVHEVVAELNRRVGWMHTDWVGENMCEACNGSGTNEDGVAIEIDGCRYDAGFIAAIKKLGDFETKLEDYDNGGSGAKSVHKLLLFRGDGFEGMVMPRVTVFS
jgi:hypothetical protein